MHAYIVDDGGHAGDPVVVSDLSDVLSDTENGESIELEL